MTTLYPRERVEAVLRPLALASAHRIMLRTHLSAPRSLASMGGSLPAVSRLTLQGSHGCIH